MSSHAYLALDVATNTGFCLWTERDGQPEPDIHLGSWNLKKWPYDHRRRGVEAGTPYEKGAILGIYLTEFLREQRRKGQPITAAVVEDPLKQAPSEEIWTKDGRKIRVPKSNADSMLSGPTICGGTASILEAFNIPVDLVRPQSWHAVAMHGVKKPKNAKSNFWKVEMRMRAEMIGLKYGFTVPNDDAADALGIMIWRIAQDGRLPVGIITRKDNLFRGMGA